MTNFCFVVSLSLLVPAAGAAAGEVRSTVGALVGAAAPNSSSKMEVLGSPAWGTTWVVASAAGGTA